LDDRLGYSDLLFHRRCWKRLCLRLRYRGFRRRLRWFNLFWVEKVVAAGQRLVVFGKPKRRGRQIILDQPEFEVLEDDHETSIHLQRITPIHRATEGLSTKIIRWLIWEALKRINPATVPNLIPRSLDSLQRIDALRQIHFPDSFESLSSARKHLVLTELQILNDVQQILICQIHGKRMTSDLEPHRLQL
jgi:RecG-like helicase